MLRLTRTEYLAASLRFLAALGACALGGVAVGQEPGVPLPPTPVLEAAGEEGTFSLQLSVDSDGSVPDVVAVERSIVISGDGANGAFFFAQPFGEDPGSMLHSPAVAKELEIIDDQRAKIRGIQREMHEKIQKAMTQARPGRRVIASAGGEGPRIVETPGGAAGGNGGGAGKAVVTRREGRAEADGDAPKPEDIGEMMRAIREEAAKKIDDVLMPHQRKRLAEISLRQKMKARGTSGSLADTDLAKQLDISDEQKERIKKRAVEVQKELEEKIAKLREEAKEEILGELTTKQRDKLKELLGADFDENAQFRPQISERRSERRAERRIERSGATKSADAKAGESKSGETKSTDAKSSDAKPSEEGATERKETEKRPETPDATPRDKASEQ